MKKYRVAMIKGICNGIICSVIINMWIILSFCISFKDMVLYLIGLPLGISVFLLMSQTRIKNFFMTLFLSILLYVLTEIAISSFGVVNMFFYKIVGDEMWAGDGFAMMVIYIVNYFWIIIGTIAAFIFTVINQIKPNKNK